MGIDPSTFFAPCPETYKNSLASSPGLYGSACAGLGEGTIAFFSAAIAGPKARRMVQKQSRVRIVTFLVLITLPDLCKVLSPGHVVLSAVVPQRYRPLIPQSAPLRLRRRDHRPTPGLRAQVSQVVFK